MRWVALLVSSFWAVSSMAMTPKEIYKKDGQAVVLILGSDDGKSGSGGTGSIITPDGQILTNAHVVLNESGRPFKTLYVFLKPPVVTGDSKQDLTNRYNVKVLGYSIPEELDLALLKIENPPAKLPTISFADPNQVEVGDSVVAIGHPEQGGLWTMTTGTISTVIANFNRVKGKDVFQTEASVNRGNSGGPLIDFDGNMVAVNTMIARQGAGGVAITGINFSLKSSVAVKWLAAQGMGLAYAPKGSTEMMVASAPQAPTKVTAAEVAAASIPTTTAAQTATSPTATVAAGTATTTGTATASTATASAATPTNPAAGTATTTPPVTVKPVPVAEAPASTIVMAEKPPAEPEKLRKEGAVVGKAKEPEKLVEGKKFDPKTAKPKYETEKRPFSLDDLRRQQMKELEDIMNDSRKKTQSKSKGSGMGLW